MMTAIRGSANPVQTKPVNKVRGQGPCIT